MPHSQKNELSSVPTNTKRSSNNNSNSTNEEVTSISATSRLKKSLSMSSIAPLCKIGSNTILSNSAKGSYTNNNNNGGGSSGAKSMKSIDQQPYARGSIIEVIRGDESTPYLCDVIDRQPIDSSASSSSSLLGSISFLDDDSYRSSDEEDGDSEDQQLNNTTCLLIELDSEATTTENNIISNKGTTKNNTKIKYSPATLLPSVSYNSVNKKQTCCRWRYYVHYRDSNRRLDEWVTVDRILSPPSVGAAMAKAIAAERKKEEEGQRKKLEEERKKAEALLAESATAAISSTTTDGEATAVRITRQQKRKSSFGEVETPNNSGHNTAMISPGIRIIAPGADVVATIPAEEIDEHAGMDESALREHEEVTKVKNVGEVELGKYRMSTWYFSPLPKEIMKNGYVDALYVCEFTFNFFVRKEELLRFQARSSLTRRHPFGNEIYRSGNLSMFEVDGSEQRIYCQNLCYLAKLFLDHKTLYCDVDTFLFYVLCEVDNRGFHPVGYFSKEKYCDAGFNLACILTFPCYQRKGYGRFLISFSYELSKKEEKVGSPEKPMSDLGQQAYKPYWNSVIVDFLFQQSLIDGGTANRLSIMDITKKTSIMAEDIIFTLNQLGILKVINGVYFIAAEESTLEELVKKHPIKEPIVDPNKLHWTPFLTDVKRDKFSIHSKRPSVEEDETRVTANAQ